MTNCPADPARFYTGDDDSLLLAVADTGYLRDYPRADGSPSGYELQRRDYEADDR